MIKVPSVSARSVHAYNMSEEGFATAFAQKLRKQKELAFVTLKFITVIDLHEHSASAINHPLVVTSTRKK